jgi:hypothetical protein
LGEFALGFLEGPLAGDDACVLIGIAVTDHDLLDGMIGVSVSFGVMEEAVFCDRELEERPEDFGAALEVFDGFKQGDNGEETDEAFCASAKQSGFACEHVDNQKVAEPARHADNERTQSGGAMGVDFFFENPVASENGVGFGPGGGFGVKERASGLEFAFEELETFGFGPFLPLAGVDAGSAEELDQGFGMESGILADI